MICPVESMVHPNDDFLSAPKLDYDGFRAAQREDWGWLSPAFEANIFAGKVRTRRVFGFVATDLTCNAARVERTESDVRLDDMEYNYAVVQLTGGSKIIQVTYRDVEFTEARVDLAAEALDSTSTTRERFSAKELSVVQIVPITLEFPFSCEFIPRHGRLLREEDALASRSAACQAHCGDNTSAD
jgi:hypothetical protein